MTSIIQNHTALITGANHGIGLELTRRLLKEGWQVIALNRSAFPEDDVLIASSLSKGRLRCYTADLSDFRNLRQALEQIKAAEDKIDVLFNNAGSSFRKLTFSKQGRELHFDLQTLAPYAIYMELKGLLRKGALKTVVNTSSNAILLLKKFDPTLLERPSEFKMLFGPYSTTKLALSLWTQEIAADAAAEGLHIVSVDPGGNNTLRKGEKAGLPFIVKTLMKLFFPPPSKGASLLYDAALGGKKHAPPGSFITKGRVTPLKFTEQSRKVLELVQSIYAKEFAARG